MYEVWWWTCDADSSRACENTLVYSRLQRLFSFRRLRPLQTLQCAANSHDSGMTESGCGHGSKTALTKLAVPIEWHIVVVEVVNYWKDIFGLGIYLARLGILCTLQSNFELLQVFSSGT